MTQKQLIRSALIKVYLQFESKTIDYGTKTIDYDEWAYPHKVWCGYSHTIFFPFFFYIWRMSIRMKC